MLSMCTYFFMRNITSDAIKNILYRIIPFAKIRNYLYFCIFLWIMMHASWIHSILFSLQNSIAASLCAHGCIRTCFIQSCFTSSNTFSVNVGGVTNITTSIFLPVSERVGYDCTAKISFSLGLMGITLYLPSKRSLNTLCPYFSSLLDAQMTA